MQNTHAGRVAAITGSARGIGRGVAVALAKRGAAVVLIDLDASTETAAEVTQLGGEALVIQADVTSPEQWDAAKQQIEARFKKLDILVNNAGMCPFTEFAQLDYPTWSKVLRLNLDSAFLGAKALVPLMLSGKWGRIVNLSSASIAGELPALTPYIASKMGIVGLTRGLANDLGREGITVNAVAPAITNTPATSVFPDEVKRAIYGKQPIPRLAEPEDIAEVIAFLTSDAAAMITGQTIMASGGLIKL